MTTKQKDVITIAKEKPTTSSIHQFSAHNAESPFPPNCLKPSIKNMYQINLQSMPTYVAQYVTKRIVTVEFVLIETENPVNDKYAHNAQ